MKINLDLLLGKQVIDTRGILAKTEKNKLKITLC